MSTGLPGTTDPNPTIVVLVDGEPYTYESEMSEAETTARTLIDDMGTDEDTVMIIDNVTPCTVERSSFGSTFVCTTCGTYCACVVCTAH